MHSYSICYVLTDNESGKYTKELLISLASLKKHMPDRPVNILTDVDTYGRLNAEQICGMGRNISIVPVETPKGYSKVLASRHLKTSMRSYIRGDFLFMDTDTVVCRPFPEKVSEKSLGFVEDRNHSIRECEYTYARLKACYISYPYDLDRYQAFYNSGVVWSRDDRISEQFFRDWHDEWMNENQELMNQDQPSLNHVLDSRYRDHVETMAKEWNFAVGSWPSMIHEVASAYIIHYIYYFDKVFLLNYDENLDDKEVIQRVIDKPCESFVPYRLTVLSDDYHAFYDKHDSLQRAIYHFSKRHPRGYHGLCRLAYWIVRIRHGR